MNYEKLVQQSGIDSWFRKYPCMYELPRQVPLKKGFVTQYLHKNISEAYHPNNKHIYHTPYLFLQGFI